jgi:pilus assembly protein CpaC
MAIGALIRGAALTLITCAGAIAALAADGTRVPAAQAAAREATSRFIPLGIGKSVVIDLPRDAKDVLVADPSIAQAVIRTARRTYLIGSKVGQTSIVYFDAEGERIADFDVAVMRDLNGIQAALKQALPDANVEVKGLGQHGILLSGTVAAPEDAQIAYQLGCSLLAQQPGLVTSGTAQTTPDAAAGSSATSSSSTTTRNTGGCANVTNRIKISGRDQVMLKVTVAEVARDVIKQLGVDLSGSFSWGAATVDFNTKTSFTANGTPPNNSLNIIGKNINATLRAMDTAGLTRVLAEPNLTAISGETANFLVGGEFPYVKGTSGPPENVPTVEFKKFGVSLVFTPVVLSEGRISLKVATEVSELSPEASVTSAGFSIPGLKTRHVETTVEIPSGGSLAMAGMIQEQTKQAINGVPGLMRLPILGTLFRSRDYLNNQTELVVIVTPYVVHAVTLKQLSRPDDGFADPNDQSAMLLGRLNRIYGGPTKIQAPAVEYRGKYGFILD